MQSHRPIESIVGEGGNKESAFLGTMLLTIPEESVVAPKVTTEGNPLVTLTRMNEN